MAARKTAKKRTRSRTSKIGRPTKCTPEVTKKVCDAILNLATREDAAHAAGISLAALKEWLGRGAQGEEPFAAFLAAVEAAESELVRFAGEGMKKLAVDEDTPPAVKFSAYKFILERRRPDVWAARGTLKHEGPDGGPVRVAAQVEHSGEVQLQPLVTRETLRELTRAETEAALALELERQQANNRDEEGVE
jgi:hypothetical protein